MQNLEDLKPVRNDVVLVRVPLNHVAYGKGSFKAEFLGNSDTNIDNDPTQMFRVVSTGPRCKEVAVDNIVVCKWTRITPPENAMLNGEKTEFGITSEDEILAVIGEDE